VPEEITVSIDQNPFHAELGQKFLKPRSGGGSVRSIALSEDVSHSFVDYVLALAEGRRRVFPRKKPNTAKGAEST
jgi:hypothetical protein